MAVLVSKWPLGTSEILNMILALVFTHRNAFCSWNLVGIIYDPWVYTERRQSADGGTANNKVNPNQLSKKMPRPVQGDPSPGEPPLGWLWFWLFHPLPGSAWADGKLAELAEQLGKMVEHPKSKSTQPKFAKRWTSLYKQRNYGALCGLRTTIAIRALQLQTKYTTYCRFINFS